MRTALYIYLEVPLQIVFQWIQLPLLRQRASKKEGVV